METIIVYGVQLTSFQEMKFAKWRQLNCVAPNTVNADERKQMVLDFLNQEQQNAAWEVLKKLSPNIEFANDPVSAITAINAMIEFSKKCVNKDG